MKYKNLIYINIIFLLNLANISFANPEQSGINALFQVCQFYDLKIENEKIKKAYPEGTDSIADSIIIAAEALGFSAGRAKLPFYELSKTAAPYIALLKEDYGASAVLGHEDLQVRLLDDSSGIKIYSQKQFQQIWDGDVLIIKKADNQNINTSKDSPRIKFQYVGLDTGTVPQGQKCHADFAFQNIGKTALTVKKVSANCGCTAAVSSKDTLEPGQTGTISIDFNTKGRHGPQTANVYVITDDPITPRVTLNLYVLVASELFPIPKIFDFGNIYKTDTAGKTIVLSGFGDNDFDIKEITCKDNAVKLSYKPYTLEQSQLDILENGRKRFSIYAELDTEKMEIGPFESSIVIKTTNPDHVMLNIPVKGEIVGDMIIQPEKLFWGKLKQGQSAKHELTIKSRANQPFEITKIEHQIKGLELEYFPNEENTSYQLIARYCPPENSLEKLIEDIRIHTDNTSQPVISLKTFALIKE